MGVDMNYIEEAKKLFEEQDYQTTKLAIYSRREDSMVLVSTIDEVKEHSEVKIKPKLTDLFAGLK